MNQQPLTFTPEQIKVLIDSSELVVIKYKVYSYLCGLLYQVTGIIFFVMFLLYVALDLVWSPDSNIALFFWLSASLFALAVILHNTQWATIKFDKENIQVNNKAFDIHHSKLRATEDDKGFNFLLDYGARTHSLPMIWTNGYEVVNYINHQIITKLIKTEPHKAPIESGFREQKFDY